MPNSREVTPSRETDQTPERQPSTSGRRGSWSAGRDALIREPGAGPYSSSRDTLPTQQIDDPKGKRPAEADLPTDDPRKKAEIAPERGQEQRNPESSSADARRKAHAAEMTFKKATEETLDVINRKISSSDAKTIIRNNGDIQEVLDSFNEKDKYLVRETPGNQEALKAWREKVQESTRAAADYNKFNNRLKNTLARLGRYKEYNTQLDTKKRECLGKLEHLKTAQGNLLESLRERLRASTSENIQLEKPAILQESIETLKDIRGKLAKVNIDEIKSDLNKTGDTTEEETNKIDRELERIDVLDINKAMGSMAQLYRKYDKELAERTKQHSETSETYRKLIKGLNNRIGNSEYRGLRSAGWDGEKIAKRILSGDRDLKIRIIEAQRAYVECILERLNRSVIDS